MNYFSEYQTLEEKKAVYRNHARALHPDAGGSTEAMQDLNRQYWESCHGCDYLEDSDSGEYATYSSEGIEQALVDPRRPVIVLMINFSGDIVGFCTIDCKVYWAMNAESELKEILRKRSRIGSQGRQIGLTATEFTNFFERRIII